MMNLIHVRTKVRVCVKSITVCTAIRVAADDLLEVVEAAME